LIEFAAVVIGSYLIGSIPFALLLGKLRGVDIRQQGSGNVGTTNVLRSAGAGAGAAALVCDLLKGVAAVFIARYTIGTPAGEMAAGLATVVGHDWSVFIRFRGGKGVATAVGALFVMVPVAAAVTSGVFALVTALSRYASLGSLVGSASGVVLVGVFLATDLVEEVEYLIYTAAVVALIFVRHRENISKLLSGTEGRLGQKKVEGRPSP
jgi:glycerol-3-phosphate acyltransferase PlsY